MKQRSGTLTLDARKVLRESEKQFNLDARKIQILTYPMGWANPDADDPYKEFWDYFFDDTNFSSLAEEIKRRIDRLTGNQSFNFDYAGYLLNELKISSSDGKKSYKKRIKRWLADGSINIDRADAFKVCFALRMDPDEANDFLFKGCHQAGLNIRSAKEAILFFCLLQNNKQQDDPPYSFDDIDRIYQIYQNEIEESVDLSSISVRNGTTQRLINEIENLPDDAFDTEARFIDYMIREADHFIGISKNAYFKYNTIKLSLIEQIVENEIKSIKNKEMPGTGLGWNLGDIQYTVLFENLCSYMLHDSELADKRESIDLLKDDLSELANFDENIIDKENKAQNKNKLFDRIEARIDELFPAGFKKYFEAVKKGCMVDAVKRKSLYDSISRNGFWVYLLPETFDTENNKNFGKIVQRNFSQFRKIKFDVDPLSIKENLTAADVVRKQVILMKCFELIYSSMNKNDERLYDNEYYSGLVDNDLRDCGFYPLYSRHYFDCLILMTLRILTKFRPIDALLFVRDAMAFDLDGEDKD